MWFFFFFLQVFGLRRWIVSRGLYVLSGITSIYSVSRYKLGVSLSISTVAFGFQRFWEHASRRNYFRVASISKSLVWYTIYLIDLMICCLPLRVRIYSSQRTVRCARSPATLMFSLSTNHGADHQTESIVGRCQRVANAIGDQYEVGYGAVQEESGQVLN